MKIVSLRFKNLNSLYGEWKIDFTHPQFSADGIFTISGPTGAGKSTILDAICLALYGRTPRLDKITVSTNEIMSRKTKECFAEVVFESGKGLFRCFWGQTKASKSLRLQPATFEISDALTGTVIASRLKETAEAIIERTGMDFNRFTQSMLLAQGGFAKFLQASAAERSPILEEITGTEIYRELSKMAFERYKTEKQSLELIASEVNAIRLLSDEELSELDKEVNLLNQQTEELSGKRAELNGKLGWLNSIRQLDQDIQQLSQLETVHQIEVERFAPERLVLQRALQASDLEVKYDRLCAMRTLQQKEIAETERHEVRRQELINALSRAKEQAAAVSSAYSARKENAANERAIIKRVREMDLTAGLVTQSCQEAEKKENWYTTLLTECGMELQRLEISISKENHNKMLADEYLKSHPADEQLASQIGVIRMSLLDSASKQQFYHQQAGRLFTLSSALQQLEEKLASLTQEHKMAEADLQKAGEEVDSVQIQLDTLLADRPLAEYRKEYEYLRQQLLLLHKIQTLEEHRAQLKEGEECPLCGSLHHPFTEGLIPQTGEVETRVTEMGELIAAVEKLMEHQAVLQVIKGQKERRLNELGWQLAELGNKQTETSTLVDRAKLDEQEASDQLKKIRSDLYNLLQPYGIADPEDIDELINHLESRIHEWQKNQEVITETTNTLHQLTGAVAGQLSLQQTYTTDLQHAHNTLEDIRKTLGVVKEERLKVFGDKNPDEEERKLDVDLENLRLQEIERAKQLHELTQDVRNVEVRKEELMGLVEERKPMLEENETKFTSELARLGFEDEAGFQHALLPKETRDALVEKKQELDATTEKLKALILAKKENLQTELAKELTGLPEDALKAELTLLEESLSAATQRMGAILQKKQENSAAFLHYGKQQERLEKQKSQARRWEALNVLIGQADGDKFSRFAQGITFEIMVSHANRQLMRLTDRYLLERDTTEPLELNVIDNYQAGERRSTKNLSGGESFYVSLALALGLSGMSGKQVRIDTLFLDEGFGTLDEESLEAAMDALTSLRHEGKLIGVISHVGSLKERINARIEVSRETGGKSSIAGPGCSRVS